MCDEIRMTYSKIPHFLAALNNLNIPAQSFDIELNNLFSSNSTKLSHHLFQAYHSWIPRFVLVGVPDTIVTIVIVVDFIIFQLSLRFSNKQYCYMI